VQDAADHPAVINALFAAHIRWKVRLDLTPLIIAQPRQIAPHPNASESQSNGISNRFSQQCFY